MFFFRSNTQYLRFFFKLRVKQLLMKQSVLETCIVSCGFLEGLVGAALPLGLQSTPRVSFSKNASRPEKLPGNGPSC